MQRRIAQRRNDRVRVALCGGMTTDRGSPAARIPTSTHRNSPERRRRGPTEEIVDRADALDLAPPAIEVRREPSPRACRRDSTARRARSRSARALLILRSGFAPTGGLVKPAARRVRCRCCGRRRGSARTGVPGDGGEDALIPTSGPLASRGEGSRPGRAFVPYLRRRGSGCGAPRGARVRRPSWCACAR